VTSAGAKKRIRERHEDHEEVGEHVEFATRGVEDRECHTRVARPKKRPAIARAMKVPSPRPSVI